MLDVDEFLPAVGQGAIGIETRADDTATRALVAKIDDADTATAVTAERAFLAVLDGSCRTPIGGHARIDGGVGRLFRGMIVKPDGSAAFEVLREGRRDRRGTRRRCRPRAQSARRRRFLRAGLKNVRLLLTRPEPDAQRTATALRAQGHDVIVAPLLRIEPAADAKIGEGPWAAILITSANAAHAIAAHARLTRCVRCRSLPSAGAAPRPWPRPDLPR